MTYSVVARDPQTGMLGVAVQSHYFGVGRVVGWAEAGVGAVATQSFVEVSYGPRGLDRMRAGTPADAALAALLAGDPAPDIRQVAMIGADATIGTHTGSSCVGQAGHRIGPGVSVQANMMHSATTWDAMIDAYTAADGLGLAERLLVTLEAAEAEGGDARGMQSAALLVVGAQRGADPWEGRLVDLRVDDSDAPLTELRRLLTVNAAVDQMVEVFESGLLHQTALDPAGPDLAQALAHLVAAQAVLEPNREPSFWSAVLLAKAGQVERARSLLGFAAETNDRWPQFLHSIAAAGLLDADNPLLKT